MNRHFGGRMLVSVAAIAAASITSALPVSAADSAPEKSAPKSRAAVTAPVQTPAPAAGPAAGPAAELASLLRQLELMGDPRLDRSAAGLRVIPLRGGGVSLNLEGRFREYVVVTRGTDGKFRQDCVSGLAAVRRYFLAPPEARRLPATEE